ncbi:MAG: TIGR02300 family protein [Hoeflea sp.]|uniref:TIGR02300 family protein n=1 Tax=Hoeflea sp. TaxID=1940281 RepID=UPI0032998ADE
MAKPELGTKRVCPETGRKFYDLNKDPIVSPYTGKEYPTSYFEETAKVAIIEKVKEEEEEVAETDGDSADVEIVSLEEADEDATSTGKSEDLPDIDDDVEIDDDDDDDTFLADDDDDDDDDVSDIIGVNDDDDDQ